jgi:hypothetical protein
MTRHALISRLHGVRALAAAAIAVAAMAFVGLAWAASGQITTVAGGGPGDLGGGGPATAAALDFPTGVAVAPNGDLPIADSLNDRVRRVSP